ncbi:MAG: hypothetical protein JW958_07505 [Candidatus Eisenbacteria bacterium]|nr:hypothetical protein [Candidatus Eisenbacteria bacterium]
MTRLLVLPILFLLLAPLPAAAGTGSLFFGGLSFFDPGDMDDAAKDLNTGGLSPGFDGDFLLAFRADEPTAILAGFGLFWSRRSEDDDGISFTEDPDLARLEMFGIPFTVGFIHRHAAPDERGFAWGALAQWTFLKMSVSTHPADTVRGGFRIDLDGTAERDADGPGLSLFGAYEIPYPLGRLGAGFRVRWTRFSADPISGLADPDAQLTGCSLFLSVSFL